MNTHTLCLLVLWFRMTSYVIYRIISILHLSILSAPFVVVVVVAIITKKPIIQQNNNNNQQKIANEKIFTFIHNI